MGRGGGRAGSLSLPQLKVAQQYLQNRDNAWLHREPWSDLQAITAYHGLRTRTQKKNGPMWHQYASSTKTGRGTAVLKQAFWHSRLYIRTLWSQNSAGEIWGMWNTEVATEKQNPNPAELHLRWISAHQKHLNIAEVCPFPSINIISISTLF